MSMYLYPISSAKARRRISPFPRFCTYFAQRILPTKKIPPLAPAKERYNTAKWTDTEELTEEPNSIFKTENALPIEASVHCEAENV